MRDYAKIYTALWRSRKFTGLPSDDARLLYLYLHTCPHSNMLGCFVLPQGYATTDLGWTADRYRKGIESLSKAFLVGFDSVENMVRVVDFIAHDPFTNPNHAKAAVKIANSLPECQEKQHLMHDLRAAKYVDEAWLSDTLSIPYRNPEPEPLPKPEPLRTEAKASVVVAEKSAVDSEACLTHFNATAERVGWPKVQRLTATRKAALSHRISDIGGVEAWRDAIDRAALSPLLTGQTGRGWRADFDWLCKAANFTKLCEGNYDPRPDQPGHRASPERGPGGAHDSMVAAFAAVANRQPH